MHELERLYHIHCAKSEVGRKEEACHWILAAAAAAEKLYGSEHREHRAALEHQRKARRAAEGSKISRSSKRSRSSPRTWSSWEKP